MHSLKLSGLAWPAEAENLKRLVAELCGLAGVAPFTRNRNDWCGRVSFENDYSTASVTYDSVEESLFTRRSNVLAKTCRALDNFYNAAGQSSGVWILLRLLHYVMDDSRR
jgi:hypothetical protein